MTIQHKWTLELASVSAPSGEGIESCLPRLKEAVAEIKKAAKQTL